MDDILCRDMMINESFNRSNLFPTPLDFHVKLRCLITSFLHPSIPLSSSLNLQNRDIKRDLRKMRSRHPGRFIGLE